jgi:hypothetical protein
MAKLRQLLRYRFDNLMARGVGAQILLLAAITAVLVLVTAVAVIACDVVPVENDHPNSFGMLVWKSLMRALDPGTLAGDSGGWTLLFIFLFVTLGGLFVLSALIGILNNGFGALIEGLRRGRSVVLEQDHVVILGWSAKIHTLLHELALANANRRRAVVVVLADRDKVEMDDAIAAGLHGHRLRVVTRRGSPMAMADLALVHLAAARAVIVVPPEAHDDGSAMAAHEADTVVLKTLLAVAKVAPGQDLHIVAELADERTASVARMVVGPSAALLLAAPLIGRLLVQTGRQSGLSIVYTELLDFDGVEIYVQPQPALVGRTFRDAVFAYDATTLIGVRTAAGELLLPPPFERPFVAGDQVVAISEDDDTLRLDGRPGVAAADVIVAARDVAPRRAERTLILGNSPRLPLILAELDAYVAAGSEAVVVGEDDPHASLAPVLAALRNLTVTVRGGDLTDRRLLETLASTTFDHVLVLSETLDRTQEMADARTMVTLLHLRDLERQAGTTVPITSEILDIHNRDLAAIAEADDFIVSNTLISLMVAQIAENRDLVGVFDELFTAGGHELYLKPARDYVTAAEVSWQTVCEAALRHGEIAIGYRRAAVARDAAQAYGVVVSPSKRQVVRLAPEDKVIVLAEA